MCRQQTLPSGKPSQAAGSHVHGSQEFMVGDGLQVNIPATRTGQLRRRRAFSWNV